MRQSKIVCAAKHGSRARPARMGVMGAVENRSREQLRLYDFTVRELVQRDKTLACHADAARPGVNEVAGIHELQLMRAAVRPDTLSGSMIAACQA
jgi:hypothetical protein